MQLRQPNPVPYLTFIQSIYEDNFIVCEAKAWKVRLPHANRQDHKRLYRPQNAQRLAEFKIKVAHPDAKDPQDAFFYLHTT